MTYDLSQLGFLLFVSALVAMLTRRLRMPYTVGLVLAGMALNFLHIYTKWHLSKDLIFSVFLPPLVFEAALFINWRDLKKDLPVVALLATMGVLLAAAVTAIGMHYALHWEWGSAIVFGVLISATDPVSVIATFNEAGVRGRLRLLIEAESLMNDGTAAVAFVAALGILAGNQQTFRFDHRRFDFCNRRRLADRRRCRLWIHVLGRGHSGLSGRNHLYYTRCVRLLFCRRTFSVLGRTRSIDRRLSRRELSLIDVCDRRGSRSAGAVLGVRSLYRQLADISFDWRTRSTAALWRTMVTGVGGHRPGDAGSCGGNLSGLCGFLAIADLELKATISTSSFGAGCAALWHWPLLWRSRKTCLTTTPSSRSPLRLSHFPCSLKD